MGATGAVLSVRDAVLEWLNVDLTRIETNAGSPASRQPPSALIAAAERERPGYRVRSVTLPARPDRAAWLSLRGKANERVELYLDPATGRVLGEARGAAFFDTVEDLHRRLLAGDTGRAIVGAACLALLALAVSGLYLRRPRRLGSWRGWLLPRRLRDGRVLLREWHLVLGTWALPCYLLTCLTGLYWSYDSYRAVVDTLAGQTPVAQAVATHTAVAVTRPVNPETGQPPHPSGPDASLALFLQEVPDYVSVTLNAGRGGLPWQVRYLAPDAPHPRAFGRLAIAPSGTIAAHAPYASLPPGQRLVASTRALHTGEYFGLIGQVLMGFASLLLPALGITGWILYLRRRRTSRAPT